MVGLYSWHSITGRNMLNLSLITDLGKWISRYNILKDIFQLWNEKKKCKKTLVISKSDGPEKYFKIPIFRLLKVWQTKGYNSGFEFNFFCKKKIHKGPQENWLMGNLKSTELETALSFQLLEMIQLLPLFHQLHYFSDPHTWYFFLLQSQQKC